MQSQISGGTWQPARLEGWRLELLASLGVALILVALQAAQGFPTLYDLDGDNDSMMRLVQIRDLLAGQAWFDMHQYRMGPEGGFLIHWSRIVDAPVAALMFVGAAVTGSAVTGEMFAEVVWPTLLLVIGLFLMLRTARQIWGPDTFLPVLVIATITLNRLGLFAPNALDHHNLQLVMAMATMSFMIAPGARSAALAGVSSAVMLAIGMETLPYVAVAGGCAAIAFLAKGRGAAETAIGFGLGFALSALAALLATVPYQSWWTSQCDAYSAELGVLAIGAGVGLAAAAALLKHGSLRARASGLAVLGAAAVVAAFVLAPHCFIAPYSSLDPRLQKYWIDAIVEAQPLWRMIELRADVTPQNYATPIIALVVLIAATRREGLRREPAIMGAFLIAAILVSIWQVRGSNFSVPFAVLPLSAWVANMRRQVEDHRPGAPLRLALSWLLSMNLIWAAAAQGLADMIAPDRASKVRAQAGRGNVDDKCYAGTTYGDLARLPTTTVLTISNLGASVILNTPHRSLTGPSHRNDAGNLSALDIFMGTPADAAALVAAQKIGLVAFCPGNSESAALARWAPDGLMAALLAGNAPSWLEPVTGTVDAPLQLYRVRMP